jgi:hypothetical protein
MELTLPYTNALGSAGISVQLVGSLTVYSTHIRARITTQV